MTPTTFKIRIEKVTGKKDKWFGCLAKVLRMDNGISGKIWLDGIADGYIPKRDLILEGTCIDKGKEIYGMPSYKIIRAELPIDTPEKIQKLLMSFPSIGRTTAEKLTAEYGRRTIDVLKTNLDAAAVKCGLSNAQITSIRNNLDRKSGFTTLTNWGFTTKQIKKMINPHRYRDNKDSFD